MKTAPPLLRARLTAGYSGRPDVLRDFELEVAPGEILGLVGESGAGKSTVALALLRLLEHKGGGARGSLWLQGRDLMALSAREMREVRGRDIAVVMQSPIAALNPALRLRQQFREAWIAHARTPGADAEFSGALATVDLPGDRAFLDRYPRQLSVGQAQRVLIAMSILHSPALLIADEPTSALDAVTQAGILRLFSRLNRDLGMAVLYISHDLLSVASFCRRIAVLYEGRVVESDVPAAIFGSPAHPYTRTLVNAMPHVIFAARGAAAERVTVCHPAL